MEITLKEAMIKNEKIETNSGINFNDLMQNKKNHNKLFYDKWGYPFKIRCGILHYGEKFYSPKQKFFDWEKANMMGCDLQEKIFFTKQEFEALKKENKVLNF